MRSISKWLFCTLAAVAPIFAQPSITTISPLPNATQQSPYEFKLTVVNTLGSVTWSLAPGSTLPPGLTLERTSGTISGVATEAKIYSFDVIAEDAQKRSTSKSFVLQVRPPLVITTLPQVTATAGSNLIIVLSGTGGTPPYLWQLASGSAFPSWLRFDPQSPDFITGTPPAAGTFTFTVQLSDVSQSVPATKQLTVLVQPAITITTASPAPSGMVGANYSLQLAATGGTPPYTWSLEGGTLPPGLTLNRTSGILGGPPQITGVFTLIIRATDSVQATAAKTIVLTIGPSTSPGVLLSANTFDFTASAGGDAPPPQNLALISQGQPLTFVTAGTPPNWLAVRPGKGSTPARIRLAIDQTGLAPGKYTAQGQINTSDGRQNTVTVNLTVEAGVQKLDVSPNYLRFAGSPVSGTSLEQELMVRNAGGGGPLAFRAAASPGSPWLSVQPATGSAGPNAPAVLRVLVNTQGRPKGATRGFIRVDSDAGTVDVPVTLLVRDDGPVLGVSQGGVRFDVREGNGNPNNRFVNVLNLGTGAVNWTAEIVDGAGWLSLAPATGSATPGNPSRLSLAANPGAMKAGRYYGLVRINDPGSLNSPKFLIAVLSVKDATEVALPDPTPSGLVFSAKTGAALDPSAGQAIRLNTSSSFPVQFQASANTSDGADWLAVSPVSGTTSTQSAALATVAVNPRNLAPGVYSGDVTFTFSSTEIRTSNVTLVVLPATASAAKTNSAVTGCTPAKLALTQTGLTNSFATPAGWPTPLIVQLANDCGEAVVNGQVVATFSNGDPPLTMRLTDPANGLYSATWSPGSVTGSMTVTARAFAPPLTTTTADISGSVTANQVPVLFPNRVVNNLYGQNGAPLAPGTVAQVYGSSLATATAEPGVLPLAKNFNGTRVLVGLLDAPLYYLSDGQLNVQLPTELTADKEYSILVAANGGYTLPDSIFLAPATPGVVAFGDKRLVAQHGDYSLITPQSPGRPGEAITIYLVGMGGTDTTVASAVPSPSAEPLARVKMKPTVTIGGVEAAVSYAGLTPGAVGLYQINLTIPPGATGDLPVVITQNGVEANATLLVVR